MPTRVGEALLYSHLCTEWTQEDLGLKRDPQALGLIHSAAPSLVHAHLECPSPLQDILEAQDVQAETTFCGNGKVISFPQPLPAARESKAPPPLKTRAHCLLLAPKPKRPEWAGDLASLGHKSTWWKDLRNQQIEFKEGVHHLGISIHPTTLDQQHHLLAARCHITLPPDPDHAGGLSSQTPRKLEARESNVFPHLAHRPRKAPSQNVREVRGSSWSQRSTSQSQRARILVLLGKCHLP